MTDLINLILLYGGKSGEHEISLVSAASVLAHLNPQKYAITPIAIDKDGLLYLNNTEELLTYNDKLPLITSLSKPLDSLIYKGRMVCNAQVVFPVIHGPLYEDGCLQGLLEIAEVAYVGCHVLSSALGMNKDFARRLVGDQDIESINYKVLSGHNIQAARERFCQDVALQLGFPLFVKPCSLGSSVGIHKAHNMEGLIAAVRDALRFDEEILVEQFIEGREIELAVLENASSPLAPRVSIAGEICVNHADGFYSYTAKYLESEKTQLLIPAILSDHLKHKLHQAAADIFLKLKCKGMARVDFFVDDKSEKIYFNEINTLPGFTSISMYPKLWQASGLQYTELLDELISLAITRRQNRCHIVTSYL